MKTKSLTLLAVLIFAATTLVHAATNDLSGALQKGLFEEEANHNLEAAAQAYQFVATQFDKDRKLAATAIFRLGEVYRKQGKTNEATLQYERVVREFSDQTTLADLSRDYLAKADGGERAPDENSKISTTKAPTWEEAEIGKIKSMIKDSPDLINAQATGLTEDVGTPLHKAAAEGQLTVASFLLANGADLERKSKSGYTPLYLAAKSGRKAMVELLLEHGANASAEGYAGTPLHIAAQNGFKAVMEVLIAHKAPIDAVNYFGQTALHLAAEMKQPGTAEFLIAKGANVNAQDRSGANALLAAVWVGSSEITKLLLEHGGDPNVSVDRTLSGAETYKIFYPNWGSDDAPKGLTALPLAIKKERLKIVELLLQNGASPNAGKDQMPPLYAALNRGKKFVEVLLQYKADPNAKIREAPILNFAAQSETSETVELLIAHGADLNGKADDNGETALLAAMRKGNLETMELLLKKGADPNIPYKNGDTPLGIAKKSYSSPRREILIDLLTKYGADENQERRTQISVTRDRKQVYPIFNGGTNSWNRFSLLEVFGMAYLSTSPNTGGFPQFPTSGFRFPALSKVKIHRLEGKGEREIPIDLEAILKSGDCSKDFWLEWGDVLEIPEADHKVNETWKGFPQELLEILPKCLARQVFISVQGETKSIALAPVLQQSAYQPANETAKFCMRDFDCWLSSLVSNSGLLRTSSDKTRVKVTRVNTTTKKSEDQIFNLEKPDSQNNLWLRDGDAIEIPEKSKD